MKSKAYLLEDPKTGILWMHHEYMEESYRVKTLKKTIDLAKFQEIKVELVSLHRFGLCMASFDLVTVKNNNNLYSVLTPYNDTLGFGAIYASICKGFAFKSVYGFGLGPDRDDYVVAENVDGKWGMIRISGSDNIWYPYNGISFSTPETIVYFGFDSMSDVLRESNIMIPVTSIHPFIDKGFVDLTKPDNQNIKEMGANLETILKARNL